MPLITLNIDESIEEQVLDFLNKLPKELVQINEEAVLENEELDEEESDDSIDAEDYFMFIDDDNVMPFEFDILGDEETDAVFEIHMEFENGRRFFAFLISSDEVIANVEEEGYFFAEFIIIKDLDENTIKRTIEELILSEEFYDAFEEIIDPDNDGKDLDDIDPIRLN